MKKDSVNSASWTTVKVSSSVATQARAIRKRLLKGGQACLPPSLRKSIMIPAGLDPKLIEKKFGLSQIFQLSLDALEKNVKDGK